MRIHHLNCISTCPLGGRLVDGRTPWLQVRGHLCCHCLLIEGRDGLILVDTGLGLHDVAKSGSRLSPFFLGLLSPQFREEMTAVRQIHRLGFHPDDVQHIVLTHLDFDHAGALDDFPEAVVHMLRQERDHATQQKGWLDRQRFRPQQWSSRARWQVYSPTGDEPWFGFDCVRNLAGLPPEVLMVPLPGHTPGHAGVAVMGENGRWLFHAGDAYFHHREMDIHDPWCTPGLRLHQAIMDTDRPARLANQQRLRELRDRHGDAVNLFCSHDPVEFEQLTGHSMDLPAPVRPWSAARRHAAAH